MKTTMYLLLFYLLTGTTGNAQQAKLQIKRDDYKKWGTLVLGELSSRGNWASYQMMYESARDTLFLKSVDSRSHYQFASASSARFDPTGQSAAVVCAGDTLRWVDLDSGKILELPSAGSFEFNPDGKKLVLLQIRNNSQGLAVYKDNGEEELWIPNVYEYALSGNSLAVAGENSLLLLNLAFSKEIIKVYREDQLHSYAGLVWSSSGKRLAFFTNQTGSSQKDLHCYDYQTKMLKKISEMQLPSDFGSYHFSGQKIIFSEDSSKIYFTVVSNRHPQENKVVEVWEVYTQQEYPQEEFLKDPAMNLQLAIWDTDSSRIQLAGNDEYQDAKILPGGKHMIMHKPVLNSNPVLEVGDADYYLLDINTYEKPKFLWQASMEDEVIKASQNGRYLAYFDGKDYKVTDIFTATTINITTGIEGWDDKNVDYPGKKPAYGCPGFTNDSKYIILYDKYDIWAVSTQGKKRQKLTDGRPSRIRYRIDRLSHVLESPSYAKWTVWDFNLEKGLMLTAFKSDKTLGYCYYSRDRGLSEIAMGNSRLSDISKAADINAFLYMEQAATLPPRIVWSNGKKKERVLYQSNEHYQKYEWPKFELISYQNKVKDTLEGILIYPANYQRSKKYPMVVYIYEQLSQGLHEYIIPKTYGPIGFSPASYFLDGYFVLLPDIKFIVGEPGSSALDCVEKAVKRVTSQGIVDEKRLGIMGHSYGGYLVNYIISNSSLFSAAASGAGISDMISSYLTMNFSRKRSNNWRFESQQYRMGNTPFDNLQGYLRNSPITNAGRITTPLLTWSGKMDTSVDFRQSVEMHLALRRLGKTSVMLLYPDEGHILLKSEAQVDLTTRIKNWFDGYLK